LQERGVETDALLRGAGLDPEQVGRPDERLPLSATTRLWQLAVRVTGDENIGLWVSRHATQTTFHALGYAYMASKTLLEAMERIARFNGMVSNAAHVSLTEEKGVYVLRWELEENTQRPANEAMEALIASILRACRKLSGHDFSPLSVELMRTRPNNVEAFEQFFRCDLRYGAPGYRLVFESAALKQELPWGNEDLARSNDRVAEEYLARLELGGLATRLRTLLVKELPSGVQSHEHYAELLAMSGRSLQRKLSAEGTSFNQVLNDTRCELAKSYLRASEAHSLTEIAFLLGFSDTSSFSRAFHRWTGVAPSAYAA